MNIFQKYLKPFSLGLTITLYFFSASLIVAEIDDVQAQKLGNFLDNAFANMNDDEKEMFMQEVQREQEKLMAMSPEERAAREEQVARELDHLMNNSPYGEWFEKPISEPLPKPSIPVEIDKPSNNFKANPVVANKENKSNSKPKPITVPKEVKVNFKKTVQEIVQAIDTLLLKTENMQQIQHRSWNNGKWQELKEKLRILKTDLQMTVNSNAVFADFIKTEQTNLRSNVQNFANLIIKQANELKTPDAMGLVVVFEGQPKIIEQSNYDTAVLKLKTIVDTLNYEINNTNLIFELKNLLSKHQPATEKSMSLNDKKANRKTQTIANCKPSLSKELLIEEIQVITQELKNCVNLQLLELTQQYKASPSTTVKRKLQWRLSELELHLQRLVKVFQSIPTCQSDLKKIIKENLVAVQIDNTLSQIFETLEGIAATNEIAGLIDQLKSHKSKLDI